MNTDDHAFTEKCPHCGQDHPIGAQFCPVTGEVLSTKTINCVKCNAILKVGTTYCPYCGAEQRKKTKRWLLLVGSILLILIGTGAVYLGLRIINKGTQGETEITAGAVESENGYEGMALEAGEEPSQTAPLTNSLEPTHTETLVPVPTKTATNTPTTISQLVPSLTNTLVPTLARSPTATPPLEGPWLPCPGTYLSNLHVDDRAMVSFDPPLPNRVRAEPNTYSTILGKIQPGQEVIIKDGPVCAENWVWWKVRVVDSTLRGWTAEGDEDNYWLVPVP